MAAPGTLIIGAGQGGFQVAASLREHGYAAPITLIGDEGMLPYQRPPLSKAYLLGEMDAERLLLRPQAFYDDPLHRTRSSTTPPRAIDRAGGRVTLASGKTLAYDHLVLALGARNRKLPVAGAALDGVFYLRTRAEADAIHRAILAASSIVVVGAGFIGLEIAAVASKLGKRVTVVEALGRAMSRAVTPPISEFYAQAHAGWGVELLFNARPAGDLEARAAASPAWCSPTAPARRRSGAGRHRHRAQCRAWPPPPGSPPATASWSTPNWRPPIRAFRRSATAPPFRIRPAAALIRLESVQNAVDQGRCVAKRITGAPEDYAAVPWFWSDQRDLKLQMVGLTGGCDRTVLRGDPASPRLFGVLFPRRDL